MIEAQISRDDVWENDELIPIAYNLKLTEIDNHGRERASFEYMLEDCDSEESTIIRADNPDEQMLFGIKAERLEDANSEEAFYEAINNEMANCKLADDMGLNFQPVESSEIQKALELIEEGRVVNFY